MPPLPALLSPLLHVSFPVTDIDAAIRSLTEGFGYDVQFIERGMVEQIRSMTGNEASSCDIAQLRRDDGSPTIELIAFAPPSPDGAGAAGRPHLAFAVPDLAAALERLAAIGIAPAGHITQFADCTAIYCTGPGGLVFELEQLKEVAR